MVGWNLGNAKNPKGTPSPIAFVSLMTRKLLLGTPVRIDEQSKRSYGTKRTYVLTAFLKLWSADHQWPSTSALL